MVLVSALGSTFASNKEALLVLGVLCGPGGETIAPTSVEVVSDVISSGRRVEAVGGITGTGVLTSAIGGMLSLLFADLWDRAIASYPRRILSR